MAEPIVEVIEQTLHAHHLDEFSTCSCEPGYVVGRHHVAVEVSRAIHDHLFGGRCPWS